MSKIILIFLRDLIRIRKNVMALIVMVGVCVLPALYAWFNIAANWDPYGSTNGIQVAVANKDTGFDVDGLYTLDVGGQIVHNLRANDQIGWNFTKPEDAIEGVKSGKYYAAVIIPDDFSKKLASFLSTDVESPKIEYYINEKKNAIAPKITDKGVGVIQQEVNRTFIGVATESIAKALNRTGDRLENSEKKPINLLLTALDETDQNLKEYEKVVTTLCDTTDMVTSLISTTRLSLPNTGNLFQQGISVASGSQGAINASRDAAKKISSSLGEILDSAEQINGTVSRTMKEAFLALETNTEDAAAKLSEVKIVTTSLINLYQKTITMLNNLSTSLPGKLQQTTQVFIQLLDHAIARQEQLTAEIDHVVDIIHTMGSLPLETQQSLLDLAEEGRADADSIHQDYLESVQPLLDRSMDSLYGSIGNLSGLLVTADNSLGNIDEILGNMSSSAISGKKALEGTRELLSATREKLHDTVARLKNVSEDERLDKLIEIIRNDPVVMGNFMASPVGIETQSFYTIANYGSAMAPFYTTLAIWVGGIVLVAILKVHVDEDKTIRDIRHSHAYLGRYLLFLLLGLIQSTVICLGDLYFLGIQCTNPLLFLLAGWISSLVYTNIIYTLTVSFGDIGKALCVVLLVVQIAGAGGTFPIEVTPRFFQNVYPFLPFTYGINAMRETVAGIYQYDYFLDLLRLLLFVPFSLVLGLFLRRPLIRVNEFFEKRLEDTKLM